MLFPATGTLTVRSRCPLKVTGTAQMSKFIPPEDSALYLRYTDAAPDAIVPPLAGRLTLVASLTLHPGENVTVNSSSIIPVALAQAAPVYHNKTASLEKALELIRRGLRPRSQVDCVRRDRASWISCLARHLPRRRPLESNSVECLRCSPDAQLFPKLSMA
jgi:hypothetical protein